MFRGSYKQAYTTSSLYMQPACARFAIGPHRADISRIPGSPFARSFPPAGRPPGAGMERLVPDLNGGQKHLRIPADMLSFEIMERHAPP